MKCYAGIGSRESPKDILAIMTRVASKLAKAGYTLRSGGAGGADNAFEAGVQLDINKQIFLPWQGFNGRNSHFSKPTEAAYVMAASFHPAWDRCSRGAQALHARNCHQVLGYDLLSPVEFVMCWTRDGKDTGGTGQAMRIAMANDIRIWNLQIPEHLELTTNWMEGKS